MNENPVEPLEPAAADFLARHATTGEPSPADLVRGKDRLLHALAQRAEAPAPRRRTWLPPEALAVAALLVLAVAAHFTWLAFRGQASLEAATDAGTSGLAGVTAAYLHGDLKGAQRLAASSCTDAACASLSARLLRAMELTARFQQLHDDELEELATLDRALSGGVETELTRAIAQRRATAKATPEQLLASAEKLELQGHVGQAQVLVERCLAVQPGSKPCTEAQQRLALAVEVTASLFAERIEGLRRSRKLEEALAEAEACVAQLPTAAGCYRLLGTVAASLGARDSDAAMMDRAKLAYQRFLEVAAPDDPSLAKVKAILENASPPEALVAGPAPQPVAPPQQPKPDAELSQRAMARELYLRGYQLKESSPDEAARLFAEVMQLTPPDSDDHQKARRRILELGKTPPDVIREIAGKPLPSTTVERTLAIGETLRLPTPGLMRVAVGDPNVVDVSTPAGALVLKGVNPGTTTVLWWTATARTTLTVRVR